MLISHVAKVASALRPIFLVNIRPDDAHVVKNVHENCTIAGYDVCEADKLITPRSDIFVEDVNHLNKKSEAMLRQWLNYHAHHDKLRVYMIGHSIYKTSVCTMLPLFNYIVFTATISNVPLMRQCAQYFRINNTELAA